MMNRILSKVITNGTVVTQGDVKLLESVGPSVIFTQCVRWKRKPIWLPTAKSKVFRVPQKPNLPQEDCVELKRIHMNYKTYMRSIKSHMRQQYVKSIVSISEDVLNQEFEEDFAESFAINESWNKAVAAEREARMAKKLEESQARAIKYMDQQSLMKARVMEKVDEDIRRVKEESLTFITPENIDEAIERALANVVNHNFAIDLQENRYSATENTRENNVILTPKAETQSSSETTTL